MSDLARDYLDAIVSHDWNRLRSLVTPDVVRIGPYGDTFEGRDTYVDHLAELMPTLEGYSMSIKDITWSPDRRRAFAELSETVTVGGTPQVTPEVLVISVDPDGLVSDVTIYIQRWPAR